MAKSGFIKFFHYFSKIFGVSRFGDGFCLYLDWLYFAAVLFSYSCCLCFTIIKLSALRENNENTNLYIIYTSHVLIYCSPIICILQFRICSRQLDSLVPLVYEFHKMTVVQKSPDYYTRRRRVVLAVIIQLFSMLVHFYWINWIPITRSWFNYARVCCAIFVSYPSMLLFFQFFCWTQTIDYFFEVAIVLLHTLRSIDRDISSENLSESMRQSKRRISIVLQMKVKITRIYGTGCFFYQLFAMMGIVHIFSGISYVYYMDVSFLNTFYYVLKVAAYLLLAYLPHWAGQQLHSRVS